MLNNKEILKLIIEAVKIGTAKFVHVKNYKNKQGEVSNYLINLGLSYEKQRQKDIETLSGVCFEDDTLMEAARIELLDSHIKNLADDTRTPQSWGQLEAYTPMGNNVKIHEDSYSIKMTAFLVEKTVIVPGEYKEVNSRPLTIAKRKLQKDLELKTAKYRQFSFDAMDKTTISINGEKIEISY